MAAQFEHVNGNGDGDNRRRRLLDAADKLVVALEDARRSSELRHLGGDFAQLQNDVTRMRRVVEQHQPTHGFEFWG